MIHIDPDYINLFTQNQTIPIGLILSILTGIILIIAIVLLLKEGKEDAIQNIFSLWIIAAIILAPLIHFNPTINLPKFSRDVAKYQETTGQTVRTKKTDFDKTKEKLPEFTNTTLIKTNDGLFQKELVEPSHVTSEIKTPKLIIIDNQKEEKEVSKFHKNFSINIIKLPDKNDQPISAIITIFTSKTKTENYLIETNYHSLNQMLQYHIRATYDEINNKLYIE